MSGVDPGTVVHGDATTPPIRYAGTTETTQGDSAAWDAVMCRDGREVRAVVEALPGEHFPPASIRFGSARFKLASAADATRTATYRFVEDQP